VVNPCESPASACIHCPLYGYKLDLCFNLGQNHELKQPQTLAPLFASIGGGRISGGACEPILGGVGASRSKPRRHSPVSKPAFRWRLRRSFDFARGPRLLPDAHLLPLLAGFGGLALARSGQLDADFKRASSPLRRRRSVGARSRRTQRALFHLLFHGFNAPPLAALFSRFPFVLK